MDAVKCCLEDLLFDAGVELVYASIPVGIQGGLVIGNKSGRQVVVCRAILDATATAVVARVAGPSFEPRPPGLSRFSRTLEFDGVRVPHDLDLSVPEELQLVGNAVRLHRGYRARGTSMSSAGSTCRLRMQNRLARCGARSWPGSAVCVWPLF